MAIEQITVALATFRRPIGLSRALEALAKQGFPSLYVLVSDDDPSDINMGIASIDRGFKVKYIGQSLRKGVLYNHLSMIDVTDSPFFLFHGDDDELLPDALSKFSNFLKGNFKYDAVFSNYRKGLDFDNSSMIRLSRTPFARYWSSKIRLIRMLSYYLCPTFLGKQNLFYGLYRKEAVKNIDIKRALPINDEILNLDEMYSFQAVCNGPIIVLDSVCYFFSEGNIKHYQEENIQNKSSLNALLMFIKYEWVSLFDYLRNVKNINEQFLIIIFFPIKFLLALFWRYIL